MRSEPLTGPDGPPTHDSTRAGYVTLAGMPNAGKSTLLNRFVGEHLSIVTPKAQTTWQRVTGILTEGDVQLIFLDTPGLLEARDLMSRTMLGAAEEALAEADVVLLVVDATAPPTTVAAERLSVALADVTVPVHVALNKVDVAAEESVEAWAVWIERNVPQASVHRISAAQGEGAADLLEAIGTDLPAGPFLYPADEIASDPVRFFVAELVRETIFERYEQEIPYSVFCQVQEFREGQDPLYIHVDIYVERKSQKGIVIGKGGAAIKELGAAARAKIETFLGRHVYLDLWVKPLDSWRKNRSHLGRLGFRLPSEDEPRPRNR